MQIDKIFHGISIPYSALVSVIFGLMILSFPIGAYVFFNSQIGISIDHNLPITEIELVRQLDVDWLDWIEIGDVYIVTWSFFVIIFVIATFGPEKNFIKSISPSLAGVFELRNRNYIVNTIKWFSIIVLLSSVIDFIQQRFGINITPPPFENDLLQLLGVTLAPVIEESVFRIILIGIPLFLFYSHKLSIRLFFKSLWNPTGNLPIPNSKKAIILIIAIGVVFGLAHVITEQWSAGKFTQATMSGIIIGWAYYRHGFIVALLIHWATNYMVFSYGYLVASVNNIKIMDAFSHSLIQTIEILIIICGILAVISMCIERRKSTKKLT